jgi:phosphinothricin acetyltransferase
MTRATLRPARPADRAAITAIYRPAVSTGTATFEIEPPDEGEMLRRYRAIVAGGYPYLVADNGERVLGYSYLNEFRPRPAYRFAVETSIYVAPEAQGQGIGRLLLGGLIAAAQRRGDRQMIAAIGDSGQAASIGLHRAMGFAETGVLRSVGYKHGRWLDVVLMQRSIGEGATAAPERIVVLGETPDQPAVALFLAASDAYAQALYPAESNHLLPIEALVKPSVHFYVARRDQDRMAVGCGAFVDAGDGSVEIKRMWLEPAARGAGVGSRILETLEANARALGATVARLETGIHNGEALRLYRRAGYVEIGPFGAYAPDALSVFMEKPL